MRIRNFLRKKGEGGPDYVLGGALLLIVLLGLVALSSASSDLAKIRFNDTYYYLKHQLLYGGSLGILGFFLGTFVYYRTYKNFSLPLLLLSLGLLAVALWSSFGVSLGGAVRWLQIGPITVQPSEILKFTAILYLAAWLSQSGVRKNKIFSVRFLVLFLLMGATGVLLVLQPATSSVFIIATASFIMLVMSGIKFRYIAGFFLVAAIALSVIIYVSPYRRDRIVSFLSPQENVETLGFHADQALTTIGSGGLTGVGYGKSTNKYRYLPAAIDDSIFAIIAEEFGFIGSTVFIGLFFAIVARGLFISRRVRDDFGRLLIIGIASLIGIQAFVNMAAISGLIPLTGVTLPFISYGGTSLVVFMTMGGIMINISKHA